MLENFLQSQGWQNANDEFDFNGLEYFQNSKQQMNTHNGIKLNAVVTFIKLLLLTIL